MNEIEKKILDWHNQQKKVAVATLVKVYGSAPQTLGAKMGITENLEFTGSISGGCVEGDIIQQAVDVIQTRKPRLLSYGISDDTAWGLGLSCGGTIEVFIEPYSEIHRQIGQLQQTNPFFCVITALDGKKLGTKQIILPDQLLRDEADSLLRYMPIHEVVERAIGNQRSEKVKVNIEREDRQFFVEVISPPARLIIIGAVHIAMPLVDLAETMGMTTIVVDARITFANRDRFPTADQIIVGWPADELKKLDPDENTYIVFVSHDEKFDLPAIQIALDSKARYIGALGSKTTHVGRVQKLLQMGVLPGSLSRLFAPIGLDLGAHGPQEIALSIISQIIAIRNGRDLPGKS